MIDKIIRHNTDKTALKYKEVVISYAELAESVKRFSLTIQSDKVQVIRNIDPIKAIVHLLASALMDTKAIIVNKDYKGSLNELSIDAKGFQLGLLSSGSSGEPKVIWKTSKNWEAAFEHQSSIFGITEQDEVMVLAALPYSANLNSVLHGLWNGATVHLQELKNAKNWPKYIHTHSISSIFLVPSHWNLLLNHLKKLLRSSAYLNQ